MIETKKSNSVLKLVVDDAEVLSSIKAMRGEPAVSRIISIFQSAALNGDV